MPKPETVVKGTKSEYVMIVGRAANPMIMVLIYGVYQFFTKGLDVSHVYQTYIPIVGVLLSFAVLAGYSSILGTKEKSWGNTIRALAMLIPYLLGCYTCFYLGLFSLFQLLSGFSPWLLLKGLFFAYIGQRMVYWLWMITEVSAGIRNGRLELTEK